MLNILNQPPGQKCNMIELIIIYVDILLIITAGYFRYNKHSRYLHNENFIYPLSKDNVVVQWTVKLFLFLNLHIIKRNCIASREIKYYFVSRRQALILC